ncbi:hypothetical protein [Chryseobacterium koreense]|nr:hypothetical protein [Chryseobacterium koreense]MBB5334317.1 hypothetical protein [Chryseobacterium koreense]
MWRLAAFAVMLAALVDVLRVAFAVGFGDFKDQERKVSAGILAFVTDFF